MGSKKILRMQMQMPKKISSFRKNLDLFHMIIGWLYMQKIHKTVAHKLFLCSLVVIRLARVHMDHFGVCPRLQLVFKSEILYSVRHLMGKVEKLFMKAKPACTYTSLSF